MNTNRTSSDLYTIDDEVVRISTQVLHRFMITIQHAVYITCLWRSKWMVHGMEAIGFFIPFEQCEVNDP